MSHHPVAIDDRGECYREAFEHSAVARVLVAPDGHLLRANRAFHAFLGSRPHELEGRHFGALTHPDDLDAARRAVRRLLDGIETSCRMQKRYLRVDGSVVWGDVHLTLVRDESSGAPRMFVFDVVEITQQKVEERVLRAGRELAVQLASARSLAEGMRLCVLAGIEAAGLDCGGAYVVDETTGEVRFVCWENVPPELLARISLFAPDSAVAGLVQGLHATFAPACDVDAAADSSFAATGFRAVALLPVRHETRVIAALGFATRAEQIPQQAREVLQLFAAQAGGALARLRAEDAARASDARVRHMAEHIKDGLIVIENDRVVYANQRMCEITGRTVEELATGPWDLAPPEERQRLRALGQPPLQLDELEYWILRPDGSRRFVSTRHSRAEGDGRNYLITTDLTERRHLEQQLLHAQKMEAIGRLAGGVAHDFNNVLTVIESCAATVQESLPAGSGLDNEAAEIRRAAGRAAALTRQLLAFGRRSAVEPTVVDANVVIADMERMFRRVVGEDIELETVLRSGRPCIRVDLGQLEQVLTNLVLNARDALPGGGHLTVETRDVEVDAETAARHPDATAGSFVVISVRDDGVGMSPEVLAHVFEPFYTTKRAGLGSGLGLATVYGVVTQTHGFIVVSSREGEGSAFDVYLPHCPEPATRTIQHAAGGTSVAGRMRSILVVEDEEVVRRVVARTLERNGFQVVALSTPRDALGEVARRKERFDLVLTDVLLPVMSGPQMVAELRRSDPGLKVLFMSGYAETGIPEGALLLPKPFRASELLRKVQLAME